MPTRRLVILGALASTLAACDSAEIRQILLLDAPTALAQVTAGDLVLVDVRRPDEWAQTGIAKGAVPIDLRSADFLDRVKDATGGNRRAPVALICAAGVRSAAMAQRLQDAGYTLVYSVGEGMLGSRRYGPGWLKRGLPVMRIQ